jgi:predicted transposase YbfD/YdcC
MSALAIEEAFAPLQEPRQAGKVEHRLMDILILALCGLLSGAQSYTEIVQMSEERLEFFRTRLGLALMSGIPSHDTFSKVFRMLDTETFAECFLRWMSAAEIPLEGKQVNIDGKTLRRSHQRSKGIGALHLVSAFVAEHGLVLGQRATEEKSNEITAIPELLQALSLKGCIVSIDAMGTQTAIVETICDKGADYLLPVKANQPTLHADIIGYVEKAKSKQWRGIKHTTHRTVDADHGRVETRVCWAMPLPKALGEHTERWKDLRTIAMIEATREINGVVSTERRYYISSLAADAALILSTARSHWSIENKLHWRLDVQMREDECRIRGNGAENIAVLRRIAFNQLQRENSSKRSMKAKQLKACMNNDYLEKVLALQ